MNEIMPLHYIKSNFTSSVKIKHIDEYYRHCTANSGSVIYYEAMTNYGSLTLVVENYQDTIDGEDTV